MSSPRGREQAYSFKSAKGLLDRHFSFCGMRAVSVSVGIDFPKRIFNSAQRY